MTSKLLFFLISFTVTTSIWGQSAVELVNLTTKDKESKAIYIGLTNKFQVKTGEQPLTIEPKKGVIFKDGILSIRPDVVGAFQVTFLNQNEKLPVRFEAQTVSAPIAAIGGHTDKLIDKASLLKQNDITLHTFRINDTFWEGYEVVSFVAQVGEQSFLVQGNRFSPDLLAAVQKMKSGDQITIQSVKSYCAQLDSHVNSDTSTSYVIK